jgi:hypothetical protein
MNRDSVGQSERARQNRVITLLCVQPGHHYFGDDHAQVGNHR